MEPAADGPRRFRCEPHHGGRDLYCNGYVLGSRRIAAIPGVHSPTSRRGMTAFCAKRKAQGLQEGGWPSTRRSGQSCCRFSALGWRQRMGRGSVGGDYTSRKRQFSRFAAGLRLKVREGHSDEFERPSAAGTRNGSGRGRLHAARALFGSPIPSIGYEWTTESRPI